MRRRKVWIVCESEFQGELCPACIAHWSLQEVRYGVVESARGMGVGPWHECDRCGVLCCRVYEEMRLDARVCGSEACPPPATLVARLMMLAIAGVRAHVRGM